MLTKKTTFCLINIQRPRRNQINSVGRRQRRGAADAHGVGSTSAAAPGPQVLPSDVTFDPINTFIPTTVNPEPEGEKLDLRKVEVNLWLACGGN